VGVLVNPSERQGEVIVGSPKLNYHYENNEISPLVDDDGFISDFNHFENYLSTCLNHLEINPTENPFIFTEPSTHHPERNKEHRMKLVELLFEKCNLPCIFIAKSGALSAFSCGKSTCLVLDSGASHTSAVPVHEGYVLQKSTL
jgi:actin-related protein